MSLRACGAAPGSGRRPARRQSRLAGADELRGLRLALVPGCGQNRGNVRVGDEALPALRVPVEARPDPVALGRVAEDDRSLRAVLLALLGSTRREDLHEAVDVLHLCRCEQHLVLLFSVVGQAVSAAGATTRSCGSMTPRL